MQDDSEQPDATGTECLILTATDAAALAGPTAPGAALAPVALADGVTFVLPLQVLDDPAHQALSALLAQLPVERVEATRFPALPAQLVP
ncbi:hypothetical protein GCM10007301_10900 [Azorhizobium oxalatiphilum]|uniref:Uncharacterized protein n=1 Tax=Azorhizobium oxalatiphilum TaxID=980631 RepID=A0A917BQJ4_9HYPH|nr:hypothetical protein [Azorhizobium oxalatiphilum]GGF53256.1 hypothetical protein GCM10007301_10900 [Azorhizobium oxalatiphilum]